MDQKQVQNIANLARLELNQKELKKYSDQLSQILDYVNQLEELNTKNVAITAQVNGLTNVLRKDKVKPCQYINNLLEQAPETKGQAIKVKSVF